MKKTLLLLILYSAFNIHHSFSQSPSWLWAKSAGGLDGDGANSVTADASGNIIAAGYFYSPTITFGSTTLTNTSIDQDIFIVKYDAAGNVLWAKSAGGLDRDVVTSVTADAFGNIIAVGYFRSPTITFGSTTLTNTNTTGNNYDIFIVKYDAAGNVLWANLAGGFYDDFAESVTADASGNIIATGYFRSLTITFGSITLTNVAYRDGFIVKYDAAGTVLWAKVAGGTENDFVHSVTADASGNIIAAGHFDSATITFGSTTLTNALWTGSDIFVVKYDSAGNVLWAISAGGIQNESVESVTADASGNIIAAGYFTSATLTFGSTTLTNAVTTGSFIRDMFIVKYDAAGTVLWAKSAGGTSNDYARSVTADASGNIIVAGSFQSATITFGSTTLTDGEFIVKYDTAGTVIWAESIGSRSITSDASGNIIAARHFFSPTLTLGSTTLTNVDSTGNTTDMYVAKLGSITVGINEMTNDEFPLTIYPNPATTEVTLNFGKAALYDTKLCNTLGEVLFKTTSSAEQMKIYLRDFSSGIYFITVRDEKNNLAVRKIVKM